MKDSSTLFQGATESTDCVCMKGTYDGATLLGKKGCVKCLEGHACDAAGLQLPGVAKGYYIKDLNPEQVLLCEPKEACIGAEWGESVCRPPRTGTLCMDCPDGWSATDRMKEGSDLGCSECSMFTTMIVALCPVIAFVFCVGLMYFAHSTALDENPVMIELQNSLGQLIMFTQVINAVFSTRMLFGEPLNSVMDEFVTRLDPDAIFSNAPCVVSQLKAPITQYAIVISSPCIFIVFLSILYLAGKPKGLFPIHGLLNVIGEVLVEFYISITLALFSPFDCYGHPNGETSVRKYPHVMCDGGKHSGMVGLSVFGILAYPVTAIVVSITATLYYPRALLKNDITLMVRCSFLFERWRPECFWFCNVTIFRNFAIAILPSVLPEDHLDTTVILMIMVLVLAQGALLWFKPRRSVIQNCLDCFVSTVQIIVLSFGITTVHGVALRSSLSAGCVILLLCVVLTVLALVAFRAFQLVTKSGGFSVYICHHAGNGGSACRVLQGIFVRSRVGRVFYDVDVLETLNSLNQQFDAVKRSSNLLVAFGTETLCRPWCIGAIVCAFRKRTPLFRVIFEDYNEEQRMTGVDSTGKISPGYVANRDGGTTKISKTFTGGALFGKDTQVFEIDTISLRGFGLAQEAVHPAVQALMRVEPVEMNFRMQGELSTSIEFLSNKMSVPFSVAVVNELYSCSSNCLTQIKDPSGKVSRPSVTQLASKPGLIMCDHKDGEAVAVSRFFASFLGKEGAWIETQDLTAPDYATVVSNLKPNNVFFLCSQGTQESEAQLARLGLLWKRQPGVNMSPVVIGATFNFPDTNMLGHILSAKFGASPAERIFALAGDNVSLKEISLAVDHLMTFLIQFINFPQLSQKKLHESLRELLKRAKDSHSTRRGSKDNTKSSEGTKAELGDSEPSGAALVQYDNEEPANQTSSAPPVSDSNDPETFESV